MRIPDGQLSFDELNKLYSEQANERSMPYDQYFGEMDLSQEQIERRKKTAKRIERFIVPALIMMYNMRQDGTFNYMEVSEEMIQPYENLLKELGIPLTAFFTAIHTQTTVADIIMSTLEHRDDAYYYSIDRAVFIAENEANSIWNDSEYQDAILTGKTMKEWRAILDKRTRETHRIANGTRIPIGEFFQVGNALLLYPKYPCEYPEEVVNCRCSLIYS